MQAHLNPETLSSLERTETYLGMDPGNRDLLAMAIDLSLALGQVDRAAAHAATALARYADDDFFQARQGQVLLAQRQWDAAAALFEGLLSRQADVNLAYNLAYAYARLGRYADTCAALAPFLNSAELAPAAVTLLIQSMHHLGELDAAMPLIAAQMGRCQHDPAFLAAAGLLYLDAGQLDEAQRLSALATAPGGQPPLAALVVGGTLALAHTDSAAAARQFNAALALDPTQGRSWSGLGMASLFQRDLGAARSQLEQAVHYMPKHIGSWHMLGWCKIFGQDLAGAVSAFHTALELDRNFGESHGGMAVVQAMQGAHAEAEASIARALGLDKDSLSARYAQMILAGQTEDPVRFRALALRVLSSRQDALGRNMGDVISQLGKA